MRETSSWEFAKKTSQYHFDTTVLDSRWDQLQGLGRFEGDWSQELAEVLETAETEESIDLSVGNEETASEVENTRAALVDFVYNRLGKKLNKGE
jgi:hypothetical protein